MQVLIVEDEVLLARQLGKMLHQLEPAMQVAAITQSVEETVSWLQHNKAPDLILMDIELADGQSFEIFQQTTVDSMVIFTTAYDEFALKAFSVNSVDYLLKPIKPEALKTALTKYKHLIGLNSKAQHMDEVWAAIRMLQPPGGYRSRFLVKQGNKMVSIDVQDVAYFFSENGLSFLRTWQNLKYIVDYPLDQLEHCVEPKQFFRANRSFLLHHNAVKAVHNWFNQKLVVEVQPTPAEQVVVSREKAPAFKTWLGE